MKTFNAEGYEERSLTLEGWPARVVSYQLGDRFACKIDNVSPGAVIARGEGATREEAIQEATDRASRRLRATRRVSVLADQVGAIAKELDELKKDL